MTKTQVELMIRGLNSDNRGDTFEVINAVYELLDSERERVRSDLENRLSIAEADYNRKCEELSQVRAELNRLRAETAKHRNEAGFDLLKKNLGEMQNNPDSFCWLEFPVSDEGSYESVKWAPGAIPKTLYDSVMKKIGDKQMISAIKEFRAYADCGLRNVKYICERMLFWNSTNK